MLPDSNNKVNLNLYLNPSPLDFCSDADPFMVVSLTLGDDLTESVSIRELTLNHTSKDNYLAFISHQR